MSTSSPVTAGDGPDEKLAMSAVGTQPEHGTTSKLPPPTGSGTADDPIVVDWADGDPENPLNWSRFRKLTQTYQIALSTFCVTLGSSMYAGGVRGIARTLNMSPTATLLGISLYVLGFGLGPLLWAPCSEMYGRRRVFLISWVPFTFAQLACRYATNAEMMLIFRFFAGTMGSAPLTGGGGGISDMFAPKDRAFAMSLYTIMPFMGPILGPLIGGAISQTVGWNKIFLVLFSFSCVLASVAAVNMRETYAPVLLRWRARRLTLESNGIKHFVSKYDVGKRLSLLHLLRTNLPRPFVFLVTEPIVTLVAIYIAVEYATLYALFAAFPIIFQTHRGWGRAHGGVAYLGVGAGVLIAVAMSPLQTRLYARAAARSPTGKAPPEARLVMTMVGSIAMPVGLFWFAWTSQPSMPAYISIIGGAPFGFGMLLLFHGAIGYIMDTYTIYCASAIAATVVLRSVVAAVFPLFSPAMFEALGDQVAMSVFAGLSAVCMPIPFLFYKYGHRIRARSKHAVKLASAADASAVTSEKRPDVEAPAPEPEPELLRRTSLSR